ncbi:hypothetical protein TeGR_g12160, partial [Tetraparma gracilis]
APMRLEAQDGGGEGGEGEGEGEGGGPAAPAAPAAPTAPPPPAALGGLRSSGLGSGGLGSGGLGSPLRPSRKPEKPTFIPGGGGGHGRGEGAAWEDAGTKILKKRRQPKVAHKDKKAKTTDADQSSCMDEGEDESPTAASLASAKKAVSAAGAGLAQRLQAAATSRKSTTPVSPTIGQAKRRASMGQAPPPAQRPRPAAKKPALKAHANANAAAEEFRGDEKVTNVTVADGMPPPSALSALSPPSELATWGADYATRKPTGLENLGNSCFVNA